MINSSGHAVEWAALIAELDDAREHLEALIDAMVKAGAIDEAEYEVQLGHVCAHLNRAWNSRSLEGEISEKEWERYSQFPEDLRPVG